ncbi:MAG: hypothetical protein JWR74_733 [Polaromonas sp.]|jgi:hypothetical protein|nr:hypothetical protein [Polaromonas sp.]
MPSESTCHLLLPFAACSADAWLPTLQSLPQHGLKHLDQLLQGMHLVQTDTREAESLSPPHERAAARALGLATLQTADGQLPWAASEALEHGHAAPGKAWAWITPCHWAMGHLHATLSDPGLLDFQESESRALLALMQPYFETDGIALHYRTAGRWLAEGELFRGLPTASLDRVMGRNVDAWLPGGPQAGPLRRLQNEMQMLLYTHPFNDGRESQGQMRVNSFWISGTGDLPSTPDGEALTPALSRREQVSAPRSLAQAAFREDWAAYAAAWQALDAGEIAQLLARQRAGDTVRLSLCGESSVQTFETHRDGLWTRFSRIFSPLRTLDMLKQL